MFRHSLDYDPVKEQVGQGQVKPVEEKVSAIIEHPAPTTCCELWRFLGMEGYYRILYKPFHHHPLTSLLGPKVWLLFYDEPRGC